MNILFRYISINFLKLFVVCIASFLLVYLAIDTMSKFWKLSSREVPLIDIWKYFLFKIPLILTQITPMATLLSTLLTLGLLSRNSEITVMKSCGISVYSISVPILLLSVTISIFSLFTNEYIVPYSNKRFKEIEDYRPWRKSKKRLFKRDKIWYFGKNTIYNIELLDIKNKALREVTLFKMNDNFAIVERIDAKRAIWEKGQWTFINGVKRRFKDDFRIESFKEKNIPLEEKFSDFTVIKQSPEEMTFKELKRHIEKLKKMGLDYTRYIVDLLSKIAFPLANIILPLIGIPYALKTGRSAGIASGVGLSIVIGFTYFVIMTFNVSLGHVGVLPPFMAAFGTNIIFGLVGIISIMNIKT